MRPAGAMLAMLAAVTIGSAHAGDYLVDATGCKVWDPNPAPNETSTWTGQCVDGFLSGQGRQQWIVDGKPAGTSEGNFVKGKLEGKGVRVYTNGARYEGDFVDGQSTGQGTFNGADGSIYTGNFAAGRREGKGVLTMRDGQRYEGEFKNNVPNGNGQLTFRNGVRLSDEFLADFPASGGEVTEADGTKFKGIFVGTGKAETDVVKWAVGFNNLLVADLKGMADHPPRGSYIGLLKVTFNGDGSVASYSIEASTGSDAFDAFELGRVKGLNGLPPFPYPDQTAVVTLMNGLATWRDLPAPAERPTFAIKTESTGSHINHDLAFDLSVPPEKSYDALTPYEKQVVKNRYDKMPSGDEPPYPVDGTQKIISGAIQLARRYQPEGKLYLIVDIDEKGNATGVSAIEAPGQDYTKNVATLLMVQKYKPGVCSGQPCKMQFPFVFNFLGATNYR